MEEIITIEVDPVGVVVDVGSTMPGSLDLDPNRVRGRHVIELFNTGDRRRLGDVLDTSRTGSASEPRSVIARLLDRSGRSIWVEVGVTGSESPPRNRVLTARPFRPVEPVGIDESDPNPYHALVQHSADIVMIVEPDGIIRFVNTALSRLLGMEPDDIVATQILDIIHPDDHDAITEVVVHLLEDRSRVETIEFRARHADGTYRWINGWLQNMLDHPNVGALLGNGRDVTEQRRAQRALAESEARFRSLASSSPSAIFELDPDGIVRFANGRWQDITGRSIEDTPDIFSVLVPDDAKYLRAQWHDGACRSGIDEDVRVCRPDGTERRVELHTRPVPDAEVATFVGSLHDVTAIHDAHAELEFLATHDPLTALPNRTLLRDRLGAAVERISRSGDLLALLFVDLDRFKVVNDSLGHHAGDEVLVAVTGRLVDLVRPQDLVARFGGDEFVVLCEAIADPEQAIDLAERIRRDVAGGVEVGGETVHVSVSVGVVIGSGDSTPEDLLRDADAAMYAAKVRGRDQAQVFDDAMHRAAVERLSVEAALRRGLDRSEFRLYYQPIVDVSTGSIAGVEALVRWEHPERGVLEPSDFLDIAEESGVLRELSAWILGRACTAAARWPDGVDGAPPALFVNLAAAQIANHHLAQIVDKVVGDSGVDPAGLVLEVTEGMLMTDAAETARLLGSLRGLGVRIAIDDFGTGYSSLSYLTRLPVDVLKIDQSFVAGLATESKDREVTGAIIMLAHALGLTTVAEGVEDVRQLDALRELGGDLAQGYLFSAAVPEAGLAALFDA